MILFFFLQSHRKNPIKNHTKEPNHESSTALPCPTFHTHSKSTSHLLSIWEWRSLTITCSCPMVMSLRSVGFKLLFIKHSLIWGMCGSWTYKWGEAEMWTELQIPSFLLRTHPHSPPSVQILCLEAFPISDLPNVGSYIHIPHWLTCCLHQNTALPVSKASLLVFNTKELPGNISNVSDIDEIYNISYCLIIIYIML